MKLQMFIDQIVDTSLVPDIAVGAASSVAEADALEHLDSLTCNPGKC